MAWLTSHPMAGLSDRVSKGRGIDLNGQGTIYYGAWEDSRGRWRVKFKTRSQGKMVASLVDEAALIRVLRIAPTPELMKQLSKSVQRETAHALADVAYFESQKRRIQRSWRREK